MFVHQATVQGSNWFGQISNCWTFGIFWLRMLSRMELKVFSLEAARSQVSLVKVLAVNGSWPCECFVGETTTTDTTVCRRVIHKGLGRPVLQMPHLFRVLSVADLHEAGTSEGVRVRRGCVSAFARAAGEHWLISNFSIDVDWFCRMTTKMHADWNPHVIHPLPR
jgi:hypothetical protein